LKHRNKSYEVNILKSGTEEYVREKEALWAQMKSITTTDDANPNKKAKESNDIFTFFLLNYTINKLYSNKFKVTESSKHFRL